MPLSLLLSKSIVIKLGLDQKKVKKLLIWIGIILQNKIRFR